MNFILKWFIGAVAVLLTAYLVPGIAVSSFFIAIIVAFVWGFVSYFIKPVLAILTLPINLLTLGLFSLVLNGLLFWFVSSFIEGFTVNGFIPAVLGAFVVSLISWILGKIFLGKKDKE